MNEASDPAAPAAPPPASPQGNYPEVMQVIGEIASTQAFLEDLVDQFLASLIGSNEISVLLTGDTTFGRKLERLKAIAGIVRRDPGQVQRVREWAGRCRICADHRNAAVHSAYAVKGDTGDAVLIPRFTKPGIPKPVNIDELQGYRGYIWGTYSVGLADILPIVVATAQR